MKKPPAVRGGRPEPHYWHLEYQDWRTWAQVTGGYWTKIHAHPL